MFRHSRTRILDDLPTEHDGLDFQPYVRTLADICRTASTPLTIGIFGTWGSGKTSLMRMIDKKLPSNFIVVWFDAWKYDQQETLWRAFMLTVLSALRQASKSDQSSEDLDYLETMLYQAVDIEKIGGVTIDPMKLSGDIAKGAVQIGLSFIPGGAVLSDFVKRMRELGAESLTNDVTEAIRREKARIHIEQVRFLEQFQDKFKILIENYIHPFDKKNPGRLIVFVDDLDRCLPEKAVEVLEAIKLFVNVPGCVFLLGLDQEVISQGVEIRYKDMMKSNGEPTPIINGDRYLEKIIQLPFQIPPIEPEDMGNFVHKLVRRWPHEECPKVFVEGLGNNPRQIKRTVNVFLMLLHLAKEREKKLQGRVKAIRLAKVVTIQSIYPELYDLLKETPRYLRELEEFYRAQGTYSEKKGLENSRATKVIDQRETDRPPEPPPALSPYSGNGSVRRILTMHATSFLDANFTGLSPDEIQLYFTLTRRAEDKLAVLSDASRLASEPQMTLIPRGFFMMGSTPEQVEKAILEGADKDWLKREQPAHLVELSDYFIGKYPITNHEYRAYILASGHKPPDGWDGNQYPSGKGDHPVVNVSWNDATAYCIWLSTKYNKPYRLPTESEWEKAARGAPSASEIREEKEYIGPIWPWGNEFDSKNANTSETKIGDTTVVGQFSPRGDSSYGCADMIGNVWEWCADWFNEDEYQLDAISTVKDPKGPSQGTYHVIRGGSFDTYRKGARCANRDGDFPNNAFRYCGFRLALSLVGRP
jgi:formylglycine-generating enzyme required for sulfatase activity